MKKVDLKQIKEIRKKHNVDILKRMQSGDTLKSFDSQSSWFPPRPVIEKDQRAIAKLYQQDVTTLVDLSTHAPKSDSFDSEKSDLPLSS